MPGTTAHPRARYTKAEKAAAVTRSLGEGTQRTAEAMGIPESTVRYWVNHPEFAALRETTRDQLAEQLWATLQVGVSEVAKGLRDPDVPLRDKVVAVGVIYDKHALLTGAATSRSESRDLTGTLSDADIRDAVRAAERIASGVAEAPEGAPAGE